MDYIQITLLSDTCISSGESYNCLVDADVCYDKYGLPYIPAKRIKGCLRETAQELADWGEKILVEDIFGVRGSSMAKVRISNGVLSGVTGAGNPRTGYDYEEYAADLEKQRENKLVNQQSVLNQFTYIRTQTAIDKERGVAKNTFLRNIRVMKKGLVFQAKVDFSCGKEEKERLKEQLQKCCYTLHGMGLNRTRGMGEVEAVFCLDEKQEKIKEVQPEVLEELSDGRKKLYYTITLKAPLLTRSISAGQDVTETYLEGSKMLGFLAQHIGMDYKEFIHMGELICSNAYLSENGVRYLPASAAFYRLKNKQEEIRDRTVDSACEGEQLRNLGDIYVSPEIRENLKIHSVNTEIRYHHSRPEDKSIGKANAKATEEKQDGKDYGTFYQLESLTEGQSFSGYIVGSDEQLKIVRKTLQKHKQTRMGYNRSSEYGEVAITIDQPKAAAMVQKKGAADGLSKFVLKLDAPMIQYNGMGMYSTDPQMILNELKEILGIEVKAEKQFLKFKMLRGYNTTWNMQKPAVFAFDKGTTLVLSTVDGQLVHLEKLEDQWLGERVMEGYGEFSVYPVSKYYKKTAEFLLEETEQDICQFQENQTDLIRNLAAELVKEQIKRKAREEASAQLHNWEDNPVFFPVLYYLIKSVQQYFYKESISNEEKCMIENSFSGKSEKIIKKKELAGQILNQDPAFDMELEYKSIAGFDKAQIRFYFLNTFLPELKYLKQQEKGREQDD